MRFKVVGGTAKGRSEPLCSSCNHSHIMEDEQGNVTIQCSYYGFGRESIVINKKIIKCNNHEERHRTPLHQLERIAWVLRTDRFGKQIGFKPYSKLTPEEKREVEEEMETW